MFLEGWLWDFEGGSIDFRRFYAVSGLYNSNGFISGVQTRKPL